jgi:hypothetical protein
MIKTTLIPLTTPATVPTVFINATGSLDVDAIDFIYRKNATANRIRTKPVMTILKFLRRIAASFAKMCWRVIVDCNPQFRVKDKLNTNASRTDHRAAPLLSRVLIWISLCNLCVLCDSVVIVIRVTTTTESQRTQRLHREDFKLRHYPLLSRDDSNPEPPHASPVHST